MTERIDLDAQMNRDIDAVSAAYRAADGDGPPPALDDAIRAAAKKAVGSRPQARRNTWAAPWTTPLAAAAMVVLSVSIGLLAINEKPELAPPMAVKPQSAASSDLPAKASGSAAIDVTRPPIPHAEKRAAPSLLDKRSESATAEPNAFPPMLQAAPAEMQPAPRSEPKPSAAAAREDSATAAMSGVIAPTASARMKTLAGNQFAASEPGVETPQQWIARIRLLRTQGKTAEADDALKKFHEHYPGYQLPADLLPQNPGR